MKCRLAFALGVSLSGLSMGQATLPAVDAQLARELSEVDSHAASVKTLSASFVQQKQTAMLKKPLVSRGQVRSSGSVVRWDTTLPQPTVLYADERDLRLYYPQQNLEEIYPIQQRMADLLTSPLPRLDAIKSHFQIERAYGTPSANGPLMLRLTPIDPELQKHVQEVVVTIDRASGILQQVQTTDADGDQTQIEFANVKVNQPLDKSELELKVPAGTKISEPMQGTSGVAGQ